MSSEMEALIDHSTQLDQEYYVETILDKRIQNNIIEYYVKWSDFGDEYNTWEPLSNLSTCKEAVDEFEKKSKSRSAKKKTPSKKKSGSYKKYINKNIKVDMADNICDSKVHSNTNENVDIKKIHSDEVSEKSNDIAQNSNDPMTIKQKEVAEKNDIFNDYQKYQEENMIHNEPEKIINVAPFNGHLMVLLKWKNIEETDIILANEFNVKWPQHIIKFYEERLTWPGRRRR